MPTGHFISYSRDDFDFVARLATDLREAGAQIWLDETHIPGGARWDASIEQALKAAEGIVVVLSPASVVSNNVLDEVSYALDEQRRVVPILLRECSVPLRIRRLQYIDFTGDYDSALLRLTTTLGVKPAAAGAGAAPSVPTRPQKTEIEPAPEPKPQIAEPTKDAPEPGGEARPKPPKVAVRQRSVMKRIRRRAVKQEQPELGSHTEVGPPAANAGTSVALTALVLVLTATATLLCWWLIPAATNWIAGLGFVGATGQWVGDVLSSLLGDQVRSAIGGVWWLIGWIACGFLALMCVGSTVALAFEDELWLQAPLGLVSIAPLAGAWALLFPEHAGAIGLPGFILVQGGGSLAGILVKRAIIARR